MITKWRMGGFTIVELLISIVIISLLAMFALSGYSGVQEKARNTQRKDALAKVARALELYYIDHGYYPPSAPPGEASSYFFQNMVENYLKTEGYFSQSVTDSLFTEGFSRYKYGIDGVGGTCSNLFDRRKYLRVGLEGTQQNQWDDNNCPGNVFIRFTDPTYTLYHYLNNIDADGQAL